MTNGFLQGIVFASVLLLNSSALAQASATGSVQIVGKAGTTSKSAVAKRGKGAKGNRAKNVATPAFASLAEPGAQPEGARIAAGDEHTCLVRSGSVVCWGNNARGQLGLSLPAPETRSGPKTVPSIANAKSVAAGAAHTCALLADETVSCWGQNDRGQLGDGTSTGRAVPKSVPGLSQVSYLAAGGNQTCVVTREGKVLCWGENGAGQVEPGPNAKPYVSSPSVVAQVKDALTVTTYAANTCATLNDQSLVCWGGDTHLQRGGRGGEKPTSIAGVKNVQQVGIGYDYVCAVHGQGAVSCWGWNHNGQLGLKTERLMTGTPQALSGMNGVTRLVSSNSHSCSRAKEGTVSCWGAHAYGKLGDGIEAAKDAPVLVKGLTNAVDVALGRDHSCALLADGNVMCWGRNYSRELGSEGAMQKLLPAPVPL